MSASVRRPAQAQPSAAATLEARGILLEAIVPVGADPIALLPARLPARQLPNAAELWLRHHPSAPPPDTDRGVPSGERSCG
jgi:hypothetical protein